MSRLQRPQSASYPSQQDFAAPPQVTPDHGWRARHPFQSVTDHRALPTLCKTPCRTRSPGPVAAPQSAQGAETAWASCTVPTKHRFPTRPALVWKGPGSERAVRGHGPRAGPAHPTAPKERAKAPPTRRHILKHTNWVCQDQPANGEGPEQRQAPRRSPGRFLPSPRGHGQGAPLPTPPRPLTVVLHSLGEAPLQRLVHGLQPGGDVLLAARSLLRPHQLLQRGKHLPASVSELGAARELSGGGGDGGGARTAPCPASRRPGTCFEGLSGAQPRRLCCGPLGPPRSHPPPASAAMLAPGPRTRGYGAPRGPRERGGAHAPGWCARLRGTARATGVRWRARAGRAGGGGPGGFSLNQRFGRICPEAPFLTLTRGLWGRASTPNPTLPVVFPA